MGVTHIGWHTVVGAHALGRVVLGVDTVLLVGVGVAAYRRRDAPGATPFGAVAGIVALAALVVAASGRVGGPRSLSWAVLASLFLFFVTAWLWFVATYTGGGSVFERPLRVLAVLPAIGVVTLAALSATGRPIPQTLPMGDPTYALVYTLPSLLIATLFVGSLLLILRAGYRYASTDGRRSIALVVGALGGGVLPIVFSLALADSTLTTSGYALASLTTGLAFGVALVRYDLFDSVPVAEAIGRDTLVTEIEDLVVVVDGQERIVDLNRAAQRALDTSLDAAVGDPLAAHLAVEDVTAVDTVDIDEPDGTSHYEASVSAITDHADRVVGHALVLRDVTDRRMRRQRLQVLNRVLRHNLRNDMTAVMGYADLLADETEGDTDLAVRIQDTADELADLGEKAREIEQIVAASSETATTDAARLVQYVAAEARRQYPDVTVSLDIADHATVAAAEQVVWPVLWNLVENAVEHHDGDPTVTIALATEADSSRARLSVADDGPGIPEPERAAVTTGEEQPLRHGTGLGLWAVKWGVNRVGGDLAIDTGPEGSTVTLRLPVATDSATPGQSVADT